MRLLTALFFAISYTVAAQGPQVPRKMQFADITLNIRDDARKEIQKDVDAFVKYPNSFNVKAERAKTYFPIIEKIFAEENVPDDMKYLVIQESALISDAVSVSNAVGFWQFKDFTAIEMGLRVDKEIDERLNIASSSRAAARYLKKNNTFFDNWLLALQAYQMGAGGVMRSVKDSKSGVKTIEITANTYWYIKKYLAHKIAYEDAVKGPGEISVLQYHNQQKRTLSDLAREVAVDEEELKAYNKWTKSGKIPDDRTYAVMIPVRGNVKINIPDEVATAAVVLTDTKKSTIPPKKEDRIRINGITAIRANDNETSAAFATRAGVGLSDFLKYNDLSISDKIYAGQFYLLGKKRNRAATAYHKVGESESLWSVSQQYGVQIKKLKRFNRLKSDHEVKPGITLWLSAMKPKDADKLPSKKELIEVDNSETFAWSVNTAETPAVVSTQPEKFTPMPEATKKETGIETAPLAESDSSPVPLRAEDVLTSEDIQDSIQTLQSQIPEISGIQEKVETRRVEIETPAKNEHRVKPGETLYGISQLYKLSLMDLVAWNDLNLQQGIKPGQLLKLSEPQQLAQQSSAKKETGPVEHEVKATDTVYSISRKYGVTIKELMDWNSKKDFSLSVGEKLKIPQK